MTQDLEEGDVVLCLVDRIIGTTVFVKILSGNEEKEGSIVLSEIAPGRIRNLRDYVVPKKKIVCKVLRISENRVDLSLRRVTLKEKKEVLEEFQQEQSAKSVLKGVIGNKAERIIDEISKKGGVSEFLQEAKENPKELEKIIGKKEAEKILEILNSQKSKKAVLKKEFSLTTTAPNGIELIREILQKIKDGEIRYISSGRYYLKTEAGDIKNADNKLKKIISEIEKEAGKQKIEFKFKER